MPLVYKKGNMFSDIEATHFLHACNCQHSWGAGVAKQLRERFPEDYRNEKSRQREPGDSGHQEKVICLYTSNGYGWRVDPPEMIIKNTRRALLNLGYWWNDVLGNSNIIIASPKINSGLFAVPWDDTAPLIEAFCVLTGATWHVWELT